MATTTSATSSVPGYTTATSTTENPKGILGKDDFMKLLLVELQNQDPTEPMDSEKILNQTSQLATLESAENTNKALAELATSLANNREFSYVNAIGKMADLGSDAISYAEGESSEFQVYFQEDIAHGSLVISDADGNAVKTINLEEQNGGTLVFEWDGTDSSGNAVAEGIYHVNATFTGQDDQEYTTRLGAYPVDSVRFEEGKAYARLGATYVPFTDVYEIY